jgi:hypothetical protein
VDDELIIEFEDQNVSSLSSLQNQQPSAVKACNIKLYDQNGIEVRRIFWRSNQSSKKIHINTRNLKTGTYYLHLESEGKIRKDQILVK